MPLGSGHEFSVLSHEPFHFPARCHLSMGRLGEAGVCVGQKMCLTQSLSEKIQTLIVAKTSQPTQSILSSSLVPLEILLEAKFHVGKDLVSVACVSTLSI